MNINSRYIYIYLLQVMVIGGTTLFAVPCRALRSPKALDRISMPFPWERRVTTGTAPLRFKFCRGNGGQVALEES